jgi:hypothetical protein
MIAYNRIIKTFNDLNTDRIKTIGKLLPKDFTRDRKMPFHDISRYILSQKGKTTTLEINSYFKETNRREKRVSKQAFCKQRLRLNPEVFKVLGSEYVQSIYNDNQYKTYKGYILTAIDGSIMEIPNTKELQNEYECQSTKSNKIRMAARARVSGIYDVENNIMIDATINKCGEAERSLAKNNIENMLKLIGDNKKIITIFDRGYISMDMFLFFMNSPIFYLCRVQGSCFDDEKNSMKSNDEIVDIRITSSRLNNVIDKDIKTKAKLMGKISVRMIKITLTTGEIEYLVTNLPFEEIDTIEMGKLYFKRWGIETAYDIIKNKLCIENISGKKKIIIEQDFHAQMLLFNMVEDLKNEANKELELEKKIGLKYDYKVNINVLVGTFREYMIQIAMEEDDIERKKLYTYLMEEIMENLIPIRSNRQFPRVFYKGRTKNRTNLRRNS